MIGRWLVAILGALALMIADRDNNRLIIVDPAH